MKQCSSGYYVIDADFNVIHLNDVAKETYPGLQIGKKCYECLMGIHEPCGPCPVVKGIKGPQTYTDPIRGIAETVDAVDVPLGEGVMGHALVFSTVGSEAEFAATLPTSAQELRNLAIIKALTMDYYDVFSISVPESRMTMYRFKGKPIDATSVYKQDFDYVQEYSAYVNKYVVAEDQPMMLEKGSMSYITAHLREAESLELHYRVMVHNELHYYYRKIVRIGEADSFHSVVVGVACEDEEVMNRQRSVELELNLNSVEYDSGTGLFTREAFMVRGGKLLNEYPDQSYDLCILKIDNLGLLNHQYGHLMGNRLIQRIGKILQTYVETDNCIAYFGDGTFASLTTNTAPEVRKARIFKFRDQIFSQSDIKNLSLKWSIYKNIERELPLTTIYEKTQYALSIIRAANHEDYIEFDQSVLERMERERQIEDDFAQALANKELVAWYQPKYDVKTKNVIGAQALVRWIKPDGTVISPSVFIPILEKTGMIKRLDTYIFRETCRMQKHLSELGVENMPISVNLSRASMFMENVAETYLAIANEFGVDPRKIPIEITESAAVRATAIKTFAEEFMQRGFVFHMDDFGAGYSSLVSLQVIPFESIKLDKTLIDYIGKDDNESLLKHVIAYAHERGKKVVAEGVEAYEQYLFLKVIGCDAIQGYYFSKPMDEVNFVELVRNVQ